jgi:antitoxin component of MazEF toxin-antitoxin module
MPNDTQISKPGQQPGRQNPSAIVRKARRRRYSLDKLVAQIKPVNRHRETEWGAARGKEAW